VQRETVSRDG